MMGLGEVGKITGVQRVGEKRKVETGRRVQWDSLLEREYGLKVMRPWGSTEQCGRLWIHPPNLALVQCSSVSMLHYLGQNTLPL